MTSNAEDEKQGDPQVTSGYWFREEVTEDWTIQMRLKNLGFKKQSDFQHVQIIETEQFGKTLVLDSKTQSTEADEHVYHETLVHPAMLMHPNPKRVYIGGGGELATAREVLKHSSVELCVMVDIDKVVVDVSKQELKQWSDGVCDDPRLELVIGDAKSFLENDTREYNVIIMDIADPIEAGPGVALYTQDFYQFLFSSGRLAKDGVFVTQSGPGSFMNIDECGSTIHHTLRSAFKNVAAYQADIPSFGSVWGFNIAFGGAADENYNANIDEKLQQDQISLLTIGIDNVNDKIAKRINGALKFYDGVSHLGLFGIPKDFRKQIINENRIMTLENPVFMY